MLREIDAVANSESRLPQDPPQLRCRVGAGLRRTAAADPISIIISSSWRIRPTGSSTPRSAIAASIQTGSTRSATISMPLSINCEAQTALRKRSRRQLTRRSRPFAGTSAKPAHHAVADVPRPSCHRCRGRDRSPDDLAKNSADKAPIVMSVKLVDDDVLAEIASHLQLRNLRQIGVEPITPGDYVFKLTDRKRSRSRPSRGRPSGPARRSSTASFPSSPSRSRVSRCWPALVLGHMRRTAATIASGESQAAPPRAARSAVRPAQPHLLRRAARSDDRERAARADAPAAVFYIDLDHFKDVNDTLGHPDRRRVDPRGDSAADPYAPRRRPCRPHRRRRVRGHHRRAAPTTRRC